ncbi:protein polybromo isoform X4 [Lycorma delicatula]|uniref:protein polybromo isoform X4 n=1 Tax=Lycorma delicatula TaxID=130591 RepID=UPI003F5177BB
MEMSKRRRTSSVASRGLDEDEESHQSEPSRKRKRLDPVDVIHHLYDTIRNHKKDDGSLLCDAFIRAPKRRQEPGYYEVVSNPIDLLKVQQKIKTDEYEDVDDLQEDIELLVTNAKAFYKRSSAEYKDAIELWDLFLSTKNKLMENLKCSDESSESKGKIILKVGKLARKAAAAEAKQKGEDVVKDKEREREKDRDRDCRDKERDEKDEKEANELFHEEELNLCEDLFTAVMTATDIDNRPLHLVFQLLPSKKLYPKYYEVIENPIDLRTIARKIQAGKYGSINEIEKDLLTMTKNACLFNEPGSQIYKDAKSLRRIINSKKIEIEHGKFAPGKSSERIRNKRLRGGQSLSAITAALPDEDIVTDEDEEDEINEMESSEEPDNPRWQLFQTVKNATSPQGALLSEPFWKLPSKRYYPDYYKEIRNAISLMQIGKKLKRGDYGTVSEVAGDMNIMFENAKKYNRPDSRLYKDAAKLQKVMQSKVQELLEVDHQYSESEDESSAEVVPEAVEPPPDEPPKKLSKAHRCLTRGKYLDNIPLKRRLYSLCKCLIDYVCEDGRQPMLMFMEKPSKKLYPDYYEVIKNPIDMLTIEANIKSEKYASEEEILNDFKLMFSNCRQYNEECSMIHEDAVRLEKVLMDKVKELGPLPDPATAAALSAKKAIKVNMAERSPRGMLNKIKRVGTPNNVVNMTPNPPLPSAMLHKMRTMFTTLRDYKDPKGRQLSLIFMKLPSKTDYPDYYEIIKKPINLEQISQKLKMNIYEGLDDLVSDFVLMFDNACKYNEPDSQIYKDALMLQRVCLQTKLQLREDEDSVPDVPAAVQELLTSLFTAVYNHQDDESRCFSDSMAELPEHDDIDGKKIRALSLDLIKRRLDGNQYHRLDLFQEDIFSCLERARQLTRTDSQVFEDSIELQSYFIRQRDELCRNGDLLHSPALNYTLMDLSNAVESIRQSKLLQEQPEEEIETRSSSEDTNRDESSSCSTAGTADNALSYNQQVYRIGDFVYAEAKERGMEPILLNIQRLWTSSESQQMLYGNQFYRPRETYHVTTRKFLEKEVFKTDQHVAIPLNKVLGRCCVLSVKDYFRYKPEGFDEKDVYVCESRYSSKARAFKKIKNWPTSLTNAYKLVQRDEVLEPIRNVSVFRERVEKHKEEIAELEEQEKLVVKEKPNVVLESACEDGLTYYEQYNFNGFVIKTGDCVYLKPTDNNVNTRSNITSSSVSSLINSSSTNNSKQHPLIQQVDSIWTTKEGQTFIRGPWMVLPSEIRPNPPRMFYKQEIFLSTQEDTSPVSRIVGKCAVLEHSEYISCRPTEISEKDVYLCESLYDETKQCMRELPRDGLKKYVHSSAVTQDEIYFFRRLINPPKVGGDPNVVHHIEKQHHHFSPHHNTVSPQMPILQQHYHHHQQQQQQHQQTMQQQTQHQLQHPHLHQNQPQLQPQPVQQQPQPAQQQQPQQLQGPQPVAAQQYESTGSAASPSVPKLEPDVVLEDSLDGNVPSDRESTSTPLSSRKINKNIGKKLVTGYILYSGDVRRQVTSSNPECNFGEISRIVGNEWRKLPTNEKMVYEEKAARMNEENAAKMIEAAKLIEAAAELSPGPASNSAMNHPQDVVFECCWDNCDYQFEDVSDCIEHAVAEGNGHVQQYFAAVPPQGKLEFQCQWRTCMRMKKPCAPFPSLHRLARHVKEVHILKSTGKHIVPEHRSKNYVPSSRPPPPLSQTGQQTSSCSSSSSSATTGTTGSDSVSAMASGLMNQSRSTPSPHSQNGGCLGKPLEPIFVTVPPRPQRLLHSEAYIKYIENLTPESRSISNWDRQLKANQQNIEPPPDQARLPAHWLANGVGNHGNILNALWTLRDFMFRDALGISKLV